MSRHAALHYLPRAARSLNLFLFNQFRTAVHDRSRLNSFPSKRLRTTFFTTEGWGRSTSNHFKFYLNSGSLPWCPASPDPVRACGDSSSLVAWSTEHPTRMRVLPAPFLTGSERSEPKALSYPLPALSSAEGSTVLPFFYFQQVTAIKFCNSPVLITIRIARGWVYPHPRNPRKSAATYFDFQRGYDKRRGLCLSDFPISNFRVSKSWQGREG